jgi:hypothetical protein
MPQGVQEDATGWLLQDPAVQSVHAAEEVAPSAVENFPAPQGVQKDASGWELHEPALQGWHTEAEEAAV